jgi:hypothetical protein
LHPVLQLACRGYAAQALAPRRRPPGASRPLIRRDLIGLQSRHTPVCSHKNMDPADFAIDSLEGVVLGAALGKGTLLELVERHTVPGSVEREALSGVSSRGRSGPLYAPNVPHAVPVLVRACRRGVCAAPARSLAAAPCHPGPVPHAPAPPAAAVLHLHDAAWAPGPQRPAADARTPRRRPKPPPRAPAALAAAQEAGGLPRARRHYAALARILGVRAAREGGGAGSAPHLASLNGAARVEQRAVGMRRTPLPAPPTAPRLSTPPPCWAMRGQARLPAPCPRLASAGARFGPKN